MGIEPRADDGHVPERPPPTSPWLVVGVFAMICVTIIIVTWLVTR